MTLSRRHWFLSIGMTLKGGAEETLSAKWPQIAQGTDGTVGAAALHLSSGAHDSFNGDEGFPLASVCKIPIAMDILALVDEGKLKTNQQIEVLSQDVWSGFSEIAKRWPAPRRFRLDELIELMVSESDNTAVETLFRIGGGAPALATRFRAWKVDGVRVDRSERQCALDRNGVTHYPPPSEWTDKLLSDLMNKVSSTERYRATLSYLRDPRDNGTPSGTAQLLARLFHGQALAPASTRLLIDSLKATTTFPARLKGLLPAGTVVAHKTGSSGTVNNLTAATNDSGVIFLPDGGQLAVSVYLKASTKSDAQRDRVIARIARAAFDSYL